MTASKIRAGLAALAVAACAAAVALAADAPPPSVTATFRQMGVPVEGSFKRVASTISYDPANVAATRAHVEIETASFDLRNSEYNREVQRSEWFDTARFPKATFETTQVRSSAAGAFEAGGTLLIKGVTQAVTVPVKVTQSGSMWIFEGAVPVRRLQFGIGAGEWKDTDTLADEVVVRFRLSSPVRR